MGGADQYDSKQFVAWTTGDADAFFESFDAAVNRIKGEHERIARTFAAYEEHVARLQKQNESWRLWAERLHADRSVLANDLADAQHRIAGLQTSIKAAEAGASGGVAVNSTANMLRWIGEKSNSEAGELAASERRSL